MLLVRLCYNVTSLPARDASLNLRLNISQFLPVILKESQGRCPLLSFGLNARLCASCCSLVQQSVRHGHNNVVNLFVHSWHF